MQFSSDQAIAVNSTDKPIPETALLHTLVFLQVSLRPEHRAVVTSDRTLTYLEVGDRLLADLNLTILFTVASGIMLTTTAFLSANPSVRTID